MSEVLAAACSNTLGVIIDSPDGECDADSDCNSDKCASDDDFGGDDIDSDDGVGDECDSDACDIDAISDAECDSGDNCVEHGVHACEHDNDIDNDNMDDTASDSSNRAPNLNATQATLACKNLPVL